jgi:hypothetical protein
MVSGQDKGGTTSGGTPVPTGGDGIAAPAAAASK